jgi:hypothetical protein
VHRVYAQATVEIDLPTHQVRIASTAPPAQLAAALTEEGYAPT